MAITVTNNLTLLDAAESTTNWVLVGSASGLGLDSDIKREGSSSINAKLSGARGGFALTISPTIDFTNGAIYVWALTTVVMSDTANTGGITIRLESSTTDWYEWQVTTGSKYPGGWQRYVVQDGVTPNTTSGTFNKTAVSKVTVQFDLTTALMGNIKTIYVDRIDFLDRSADTTKTPINVSGTVITTGQLFAEIKSDSTQDPLGIITQGTGVLMCQGPILLGDTGTGSDTLTSQSEKVIFSDQKVQDGFYELRFAGNSTGTNTHEWGTVTGFGSTAIGSKGTTVSSAGPRWLFNATNANVDNLKFYGCTFEQCAEFRLGDTSTQIGGTGKTIHLVDCSIRSPNQILRNIASASTINEKGITVSFASDTTASIDLIDGRGITSSNFQIIGNATDGGKGFKNSSTTNLTNNLTDFNFNNMDKPYITIAAESEVWNSINPTWTITDQTELDFLGSNQGEVNEKFQVNVNVQQPDGTKINTARVKIVEENPTPAIVNQASTDTNGDASFQTLRRKYTATSPTSALTVETHSSFALKVYKYGKSPFAGSQTIDSAVSSGVTLLPDTFQVETDEATARSDGTQKVVLVESVSLSQSHSIIKFTGGTGTLDVGNTVTGATSGATGVVEEIIEGDSTAGTVILKSRNSIAYSGTETLNESGASTDWSATLTSGSEKRFYWLVQAGSIGGVKRTLQQLYDHFQAKLAEDPLDTADGWDKVIIDGRAEYANPIQGVSLGSTNSFKTVRNSALTHGWVISGLNSLAGLNSYTANDGTIFAPETTVNLEINNPSPNFVGARCRIETDPGGTELMNQEAINDGGVYRAFTTYKYTSDQPVIVRARKVGFLPFETTSTITSNGLTVTAVWQLDTIADKI